MKNKCLTNIPILGYFCKDKDEIVKDENGCLKINEVLINPRIRDSDLTIEFYTENESKAEGIFIAYNQAMRQENGWYRLWLFENFVKMGWQLEVNNNKVIAKKGNRIAEFDKEISLYIRCISDKDVVPELNLVKGVYLK